MGLVKFGQQTLNIDQVPDGHVIVSSDQLASLKQASDSYLLLKSKIPVGVSEDQLAGLVERGQRFDAINGKLDETSTKLVEAEKKVKSFSNLPQDFSVEKWNSFVQREQDEIFTQKIDTLTKKVYEKVQQEQKVKIEVDPRFIPADELEKFNPDDPKAFETWYDIMDRAHTAQLEFIKNKIGGETPSPGAVGGIPNQGKPPQGRPVNDVVTGDSAKLGHF